MVVVLNKILLFIFTFLIIGDSFKKNTILKNNNSFKSYEKYNVIIYSSKCLPDRPLINGLNGKELIIKWLQKYDVLKYVKDLSSAL